MNVTLRIKKSVTCKPVSITGLQYKEAFSLWKKVLAHGYSASYIKAEKTKKD